jgi:hypothetical protein
LRSYAGWRACTRVPGEEEATNGRKKTMLKSTVAAVVAVALVWATPTLAQNPPPQTRIYERLDVSFRNAAGEFLGRLALSDVTTSHSAVEGYLQGPDGYVFYCEPTLLAESNAVQIEANARGAVADIAPVIPLLLCPEVEFQGGGPPGSLSLQCAFDGRRREVIRRTQRSIDDEPRAALLRMNAWPAPCVWSPSTAWHIPRPARSAG